MTRKLSLAVAVAAALAAGAAQAQTIRLMTGPQGGGWVPLGGSLKNMWEKAIPGLQVQTSPGAGIANVRGVDEGKADVGFGNSITSVDGVAGRAPFTKKVDKACQLANLYPQYFQVAALASSNINGIADLKGKSIAVQPKDTAELISQQILQAVGLSYQSAKVSFVNSYTDAAALFEDGARAGVHAGHDHPRLVHHGRGRRSRHQDGAGDRRDRRRDAQDEPRLHQGRHQGRHLSQAGPGRAGDRRFGAHLVVSCSLPEQTVYQMAKAMADNVADMAAINKAMTGLTPKTMAQDIGVPFHPGAVKFYKEAGAM